MQVRCPHCRSPIELTDETSMEAVDCPSCGSRFSLVGTEETQDYFPGTRRRIAHFELIEQLGAGAFGAVWRARDTELDREVAIKMPRKGQLTPEESEKFLREARAAAQLNHPGIVSVHEVGREDDTVYIVSDLVEGVTLTDWLSGHRPTPREAAELCARIADALQHAHDKGVTHRDLKPGNLMIDRQGKVHLMDFGLAKRDVGEVTMTVDGQILGTPAYLSPEAARGDAHKADARSDIYSLGVILFEMLTGERPFRGNTRMLIHQLLTEDAPSPRKLNATIPKDLETIVTRCLEREPSRRIGDARGLATELCRYLRSEPIVSRPISRVERLIKWCKRSPRVASLAATTFLSLIAGIIFSSYWAFKANLNYNDLQEQTYALSMLHAYNAERIGDLERVDEWLGKISSSEGEPTFEQRFLVGRMNDHTPNSEHEYSTYVRGVAYAPDGQTIVVMLHDGEVIITSPDSPDTQLLPGQKSSEGNPIPPAPANIEFSPDGQYLFTAVGKEMHRWHWDDPKTHQQRTFDGVIASFDISNDGKRIAVGFDDGTIHLMDSRFSEERPLWVQESNKTVETKVTFSSDDQCLLSAGFDKVLKCWDVESGKLISEKPLKYECWLLRGSPKTPYVVAGGSTHLEFWQVGADRQLQSICVKHHQALSADFSPDGELAVVGDRQGVRIYELVATDPRESERLLHRRLVWDVAFSGHGSSFATCSEDGTVKIWNTREVRARAKFVGPLHWFTGLSTHADGDGLLVSTTSASDGAVALTRFNGGNSVKSLEAHSHAGKVLGLCFTKDGRFIASVGQDGKLIISPVDNLQKSKILLSAKTPIWSVACAAGGQIAAAGSDGFATILQIHEDGAARLLGSDPSISWNRVSFASGKRLIVLGGRRDRAGVVQLWSYADSEPVLLETLDADELGDSVYSVAFSSDESKLAVSHRDGKIQVYAINAPDSHLFLRKICDVRATPFFVQSMAFSSGSDRLITASPNGLIRIWRFRQGQAENVGTFDVGEKVREISLIPDDSALITLSQEGWLRRWPIPATIFDTIRP